MKNASAWYIETNTSRMIAGPYATKAHALTALHQFWARMAPEALWVVEYEELHPDEQARKEFAR